jgi:hypothetical protein
MRKIKNTTGGGLGTYIGNGLAPDGKTILEREHVVFASSAVTEIDDKKLAEAVKDPIVKGWFDDGSLVDQTVSEAVAKAAAESKPAEAKGSK